MSELGTLPEQFDRLLNEIRTGYSLEEWRYAFRNVIYLGAIKILEDFPEIIVGPPPAPSQQQQQQQQPQQPKRPSGPGGGLQGGGPLNPIAAGQPPPYRPSAIHELLCVVLGTCHQQN